VHVVEPPRRGARAADGDRARRRARETRAVKQPVVDRHLRFGRFLCLTPNGVNDLTEGYFRTRWSWTDDSDGDEMDRFRGGNARALDGPVTPCHGHVTSAPRPGALHGKQTMNMIEHILTNLRIDCMGPNGNPIEDELVDEAVQDATRDALEQALSYLEGALEQVEADDTMDWTMLVAILHGRIRSVKRRLGIGPTKDEVRAQTRERVRQHRERKRAAA